MQAASLMAGAYVPIHSTFCTIGLKDFNSIQDGKKNHLWEVEKPACIILLLPSEWLSEWLDSQAGYLLPTSHWT